MLNSNIRGINYSVIKQGKGTPSGYSDALDRSMYSRTSFHCVTNNTFTLQVSNVMEPDESSDTDWVDIVTAENGFVELTVVSTWVRIKGLSAGDRVLMQSIEARH